MIKRSIHILLFVLLSIGWQNSQAQLIYFSDSFGILYTVDISSGNCDVAQIGQLVYNGFTFVATDLAFHPNGNLYAVDGISLYIIDPGTLDVSLVGNLNTPSDFVNALVCDSDGVMYGADTRLFTINIATGEATSLGFLSCESAGDLAFNNGELYLACQGNNLLQVNVNNPTNSEVVGIMAANAPFFGIVTFATECSDVQTFGTAGNSLYEINVENANSNLVCDLAGATEVYGAAMETDFIASDCEFVVELDLDNSSGALEYDFFADTLCGSVSSPIADGDPYVIAEGVVDSMVIKIANGQFDGNDEQLILDMADNLNIFGSGTNHLVVVSTGNVTEVDLAHVLEHTMYINNAIPYTAGTREITVQIFAEEENTSNVATAFITLISPDLFSIDLGPDSMLCLGETLILDAFYPGAITYEWQDGSSEETFEVVNSGLYSVTVTDVCGSTAMDEVLLSFEPPIEDLDLGPDITLCPGESLTLDATIIDGTAYEWNDDEVNAIRTITETGYYAVSVTAACGVQTDDIFVEFQEIPAFEVLPQDTALCEGETLTLNATLEDALSYSWVDGSTEPILTVSTSGAYPVTVTFQCGEYYDDIFVTYNDYEFTVDLGPDSTFCFGDSVILNTYSPYAVSYSWEDGNLNNEQVVNMTGIYGVTISDGCTEISDQVYLEVESCCDVFVPNIFSPNFDGTNDNFLAYSNCDFPVYNLKVFNRWGALVFQTNDQHTGWNGVINGKDGQEGVYVWVIEYFDGITDQIISGDLTLVK